jgi:hypothetical protein
VIGQQSTELASAPRRSNALKYLNLTNEEALLIRCEVLLVDNCLDWTNRHAGTTVDAFGGLYVSGAIP